MHVVVVAHTKETIPSAQKGVGKRGVWWWEHRQAVMVATSAHVCVGGSKWAGGNGMCNVRGRSWQRNPACLQRW